MRERLMDIINQTSIELYRSEYDELVDALIDNGVIVLPVLPERVVYRISGNQMTGEYNVYELRVGSEYISDSEISVFCHPICNGVILTSYEVFTNKDIGKTVFLAREAAEAALKARNKT